MASTDRDALVALYRSTDGANWKINDNWDTDAELSTWHGVIVNDEGRVVTLTLCRNDLRGTVFLELPDEHVISSCGVIWDRETHR